MPIINPTWDDCKKRALALGPADDFVAGTRRTKVYGIPRGGIVPALLGQEWWTVVFDPKEADMFVDDIIGSGKTRELYAANFPGVPFTALYDLTGADKHLKGAWIKFPWETNEQGGGEENVRRILQALGENPDRAGLLDTPSRFIRAMRELTAGLRSDPKEQLKKQFPLDDVADAPSSYDDIILSGPLPFVSLCEHHLLPFHGVAWIGYLPKIAAENEPKPPVVGLSKLARLLDGYALRLQVQERLTRQIADAINEVLAPSGVGVVIKAQHSCQCFRGVKKSGEMKTSAMLGCFRKQGSARAEFMSLLQV